MNKEMLNLLKKKKELINQIITIREKTNYYELNNLLLISKKYLKDNNDTLILSEYINKINKKLKKLWFLLTFFILKSFIKIYNEIHSIIKINISNSFQNITLFNITYPLKLLLT